LGPRLWNALPTPSTRPLSEQITLDRKIVITEDIGLHCVWSDRTIWIKPIPAYLGSWAWWVWVLDWGGDAVGETERTEKEELYRTALGFLKTWGGLVRRRSDWGIARREGLVEGEEDVVTFERFVAFISAFDGVRDSDVSVRWRFGELNLSALNFHSFLFLRHWHRNRWESRYGAFFERFFPVVLFMFALFSVILSAMQVIVGAEQLKMQEMEGKFGNGGLRRTIGIFVWCGTEAIGWSLAFGILFVVWWIVISSIEAWKRNKMERKWKSKWRDEEEGKVA
ncbi:hypothetical protein B0J11DRAFT_430894, partial [Dendryphion nanum]